MSGEVLEERAVSGQLGVDAHVASLGTTVLRNAIVSDEEKGNREHYADLHRLFVDPTTASLPDMDY